MNELQEFFAELDRIARERDGLRIEVERYHKRVEGLRAALTAMRNFRRVDGTRLDQGVGYEFADYASEVLAEDKP